jgi:hypothetical protein
VATDPHFARSGTSGLLGKLSEDPINGLKLPVVVEEKAKLLAAEAHLPYLEWLRECISLAVIGRDELERRFHARLDAIEGKTQER